MVMDLSPFHGIFPAGMTFFDADGNLDERATLEHWEWLVSKGVHGLVVAGTSGEFIALTIEERMRLFQLAAEKFGGKVPLIAGSGHCATKLTIEISQAAQQAGLDALIVILPYYSRPPLPAVMDHFRSLRTAVDIPVMLYNNPANTACAALNAKQIAQLVDEDVVHMVKSTMESVVPIHDLGLLVGDRMRTFYGSFLSAYEAFTAGAHGWVSGVLNVATEEAIAMYRAVVEDRDIEQGLAHWQRILPIVHLYTYSQIGAVSDIAIYRGILNLWGRQGGFCRRPFDPLNDAQMETLQGLLTENNWMRN